jgi:Na+-driven multidrug efflux pump
MIQIFIAILNFVLNLIWDPVYGWKGAAIASLVSDGSLALLLWLAVLISNIKVRVRVEED